MIYVSYNFSSPRFNLVREVRCCFSWSSISDYHFFSTNSFWFSFLLYLFHVLSSALVSEALFALIVSFLSERLCLFFFLAKAALA